MKGCKFGPVFLTLARLQPAFCHAAVAAVHSAAYPRPIPGTADSEPGGLIGFSLGLQPRTALTTTASSSSVAEPTYSATLAPSRSTTRWGTAVTPYSSTRSSASLGLGLGLGLGIR